jgi:hypothetical protein
MAAHYSSVPTSAARGASPTVGAAEQNPRLYSCRSAAIGLMREALRAGM